MNILMPSFLHTSVHRQQCLFCLLPILLLLATGLEANPTQVYQQSLQMAANARQSEAIAALQASASLLPDQHMWKTRMLAAAILLDIRRSRQDSVPAQTGSMSHLALASAYAKARPIPVGEASWPMIALAVALPGAGHAWQGRWRDAGVAALLVWPMLLLTLWAARRRMGPVTVFFAMITLWLWSGTVFSSISLAERTALEAYSVWWQGMWQASGLPGRPW